MSAKNKLNSFHLSWILGASLLAGAFTGSIGGVIVAFVILFGLCVANGDIRK